MAEDRRRLALSRFQEYEQAFQCPVCGSRMSARRPGRLVCRKKHSFDLSRDGCVNFNAGGRMERYPAALFRSRRHIFELGFYAKAAEALAGIVKEHLADRPGAVLDAGCGEGYYLRSLIESGIFPKECQWYGLDLSKEAVAMAAKKTTEAAWCIADLARMPFRNRSMDVILNILTPANYGEFGRALKKDGILIKAFPGEGYLQEIRRVLPQGEKTYSSQQVKEYAQEHMEIKWEQEVRYTCPIDQGIFQDFFVMTPMTGGMAPENIPDPPGEMTIHFRILAGKILPQTKIRRETGK